MALRSGDLAAVLVIAAGGYALFRQAPVPSPSAAAVLPPGAGLAVTGTYVVAGSYKAWRAWLRGVLQSSGTIPQFQTRMPEVVQSVAASTGFTESMAWELIAWANDYSQARLPVQDEWDGKVREIGAAHGWTEGA